MSGARLETPELRAAHWLSFHGLDLELTEALAARFRMERGERPKLDQSAADEAKKHYGDLVRARI